MSQEQVELEELLKYLKSIRSYEKQHVVSEKRTIGMMWGLFILIGGLIDGYISILAKFSPHFVVWSLVIAGAIISQYLISNQPLLFQKTFLEDIERQKISKLEVMAIVLIFFITVFIGEYNLAFVLPFIGFSFGTMNLVEPLRKIDQPKMRDFIVGSSFIFAAVLQIILYLVRPESFIFFGLIFGLIVGTTTFLFGYFRNQVQEETN